MKPKKVGRPVSKNPKINTIKIRMDNTEIKVLDECCKKLNLNRSDLIRQGIKAIYANL